MSCEITSNSDAPQEKAPELIHSLDNPSKPEASPKHAETLFGESFEAERICSTPCDKIRKKKMIDSH